MASLYSDVNLRRCARSMSSGFRTPAGVVPALRSSTTRCAPGPPAPFPWTLFLCNNDIYVLLISPCMLSNYLVMNRLTLCWQRGHQRSEEYSSGTTGHSAREGDTDSHT